MSSTIKQMNAITFVTPGSEKVLNYTQTNIPLAQKGEILIKVAAAGVNRPDILQRMGVYNPPKNASPILGLEVAGTIETIAIGVSTFKVGDKVIALTNGEAMHNMWPFPPARFYHCLTLTQ